MEFPDFARAIVKRILPKASAPCTSLTEKAGTRGSSSLAGGGH